MNSPFSTTINFIPNPVYYFNDSFCLFTDWPIIKEVDSCKFTSAIKYPEMKKSSPLKQFKYSIPLSALSLAGMKETHIAAEHLPLMEVAIDFENGVLKLEGDWQFMMASNKHNKISWFGHHRQRVKIETAIYPALTIDLNDPESDCFVFPMEGNIKDGNHLSPCSGLLVFDNIRENNGFIGNHWSITFYLYETQFDDCEIKFKLPLCQTLLNKNNN